LSKSLPSRFQQRTRLNRFFADALPMPSLTSTNGRGNLKRRFVRSCPKLTIGE
uniref:Uncharacterized protein n=1 Tax=Haemonchus placei TaxID=6290 RepID=A0A0N4XBI8_HAEPC